jgi:simple sugar transport system ATP-binding protein
MLGAEAAAVEGDGSRPRDTELRGTDTAVRLDGVRLFARSEPLSLDLRAGEVTGVFGLLGAGKSELAAGIAGASPFAEGTMTLHGKNYAPRHPADAIARGVCLVPEDRAAQAMLPGWSITRTTTLPFLRRFASKGFTHPRAELAHATNLVARFGVVAERPQQTVDSLSGGNQQKVVVGRWMEPGVSVLVLDEPFRGVDIGARHELSMRVRELAGGGATVVVFASDVDEILAVCDRILVLAEGVVVADRYHSETSRDELLADVSAVREDSADVTTEFQGAL